MNTKIIITKELGKKFRDRYTPVDDADSCWLWTGWLTENGYGQLRDENGKNLKAHRISYTMFVGPIEDGLTINHKCFVKNCVRPTHLEVITAEENVKHYWDHIGRIVPALTLKEEGRSAYYARWAEERRDKKLAGQKKWRDANKERIAEYQRAYRKRKKQEAMEVEE